MDGFNEKKWFVYLVDHHEGPFSLADIQGKMAEGQVTQGSFVWAEGMADWKPMTEVSAFGSVLSGKPLPASAPVAVALEAAPASELVVMAEAAADVAATPVAEPVTAQSAPSITITAAAAATQGPTASTLQQGMEFGGLEGMPEKRRISRGAVMSLAALVPVALGGALYMGVLNPVLETPVIRAGTQAISDLTEPYVMMAVDRMPALAQWVSPIPRLTDVTPEDYDDLQTAALGKIEEKGPKVSVALSQEELFTPQFYIASNLPEGTEFEVYVEGQPDTLLNHLSFSGQAKARLTKRLAKSEPIRFPDGKPLPRGEYLVYVMESEQQPDAAASVLEDLQPFASKIPAHFPKGRKLISKKSYFLGGKKDAIYSERLKEFHEKLRVKASAELNEVRQFAITFESQLGSSTANFLRLRKSRSARSSQKSWNDFNTKWVQLDSQLSETIQKWTPESLEKDYFYGSLYHLTRQAAEAVVRVHGLHHAFFTGAVDTKSFDIQLGEATSQAQTALTTLRAKMDQVERLAPTPNGMPRREGI